MHDSVLRKSSILLFACCALALSGIPPVAAAHDAKPAAMPTAPSAGKALICIYRPSKFVGTASHDTLFVNRVFLAKLLNSEYACTEVAPGTVIVSGVPKMYYGGVIMSSAAALKDVDKKENERYRLDAEAGKAYYFKWSSEAMTTGVKVMLMDPVTAVKEMSKLHPSKPPEDKDKGKPEQQ
jgi:hypothetical protein